MRYIVKDNSEGNDIYSVYFIGDDNNEYLVANFNQCSNAEVVADVMTVDLSERNWLAVNMIC